MNQKVIAAICVLGVVASLASAQTFNQNKCQQQLRASIEKYRATIVGSLTKFTSSLQNSASSATDLGPFQKDIDRLFDSLNEMLDISNGFNVGRFTELHMGNMVSIVSITRTAVRLNLLSGGIEEYLTMSNTIYAASTTFMSQVTTSCMPARKIQPANEV